AGSGAVRSVARVPRPDPRVDEEEPRAAPGLPARSLGTVHAHRKRRKAHRSRTLEERMDAHRLKLLARLGALNFVEEPSGDSGGGAPAASTKETSDEETSGDEDDKGSGDEDEDSDKGGGVKPITTQDERDRASGPRRQRERAKLAGSGDLEQHVADQEATVSAHR